MTTVLKKTLVDMKLKPHPVAELFPMLPEAELKGLADDIKANGLQIPIRYKDEYLLDGRNRLKACQMAGVKPTYLEFEGNDVLGFIISVNIKRRHLTQSQKAMLAVQLLPFYEREAKERQGHGKTAPGKTLEENLPEALEGRARDKVGEVLGVSGRSVSDAKKISEESPELALKVTAGEVTVSEAMRTIRKAEHAKAKPLPIPKGVFDIIYADPPWRYEHSETSSREIENHYPTMDLDEIKRLKIPAAENAILFLWATSPKLAESIDVINSWGFEYRTNMVWVKDKIGISYYARQQHEILLICRKGNPGTPKESDRPSSIIEAPRGKHSRKPDIVYTLIEKMFPGRKYLVVSQ